MAIQFMHKRFRGGRESIKDDNGRGKTSPVTPTSIADVKNVINSDRRYTVRGVCDLTGMGVRRVYGILSNHLHMRKLSSRWIPRVLTPEQMEKRVVASRKFYCAPYAGSNRHSN